MTLAFTKMHGLGNDFAVFDHRDGRPFAAAWARPIADRRTGVGCDQVIVLEPSLQADVFMRIYNADGSEAGACGNATRCVAMLVMGERAGTVTIETISGLLPTVIDGVGIEVDMGPVRTGWQDIPLDTAHDTKRLDFGVGPLNGPVAVNVGNPHVVFFVEDVHKVDLDHLGPIIERHPLFPESVNVGLVTVLAPDRLRYRVWERGVGITQACGSGACAALAAAHRRDHVARKATVVLDGGELVITWRESDNHVLMRGSATQVYSGVLNLDLDAAARRSEAA